MTRFIVTSLRKKHPLVLLERLARECRSGGFFRSTVIVQAGLIHMRLVATTILSLLAVVACTKVQVGQHVVDSDYAGSPQRIFIVNRMDAQFQKSFPDEFAAAVEQDFTRCNVAVVIYRPDPADANAAEKVKAAIENFRPDTTLNIQQTNRTMAGFREVIQGTYTVILHDLARDRDIWRGVISASAIPATAGGFLVDRGKVGADVADQLLRAMVGDNAIKTCPTLPVGNAT